MPAFASSRARVRKRPTGVSATSCHMPGRRSVTGGQRRVD